MGDRFLEAVKALKDKGLSRWKIAGELKASRSKVREALQKLKAPGESQAPVPEERLREIIREELEHGRAPEEAANVDGRFPVIRKMGGGMEMIAPEAVLRQYMGGTPEEEIELRAIMKFRAATHRYLTLWGIWYIFRATLRGGLNMQGYCMKCKAKKEIKNSKSITMKNGRPATQGVCPSCGTKIFRIGKA